MSRSSWSLLVSDVVFTSLYNKQSSGKSLAEECKFSGRSFMKVKISLGKHTSTTSLTRPTKH
jgi:hypothetical protein